MILRLKTREMKPQSPSHVPARKSNETLTLLHRMWFQIYWKTSLAKKVLATVGVALVVYALMSYLDSNPEELPFATDESDHSVTISSRKDLQEYPENSVKIYLYDLPTRFTYGIIEHHSLARGGRPAVDDITKLSYPGHQYMGEWFLFRELLQPYADRIGSPVVRVLDPDDADLFFVPFFSSLSLIANANRPASEPSLDQAWPVYNDEETQEALVEWLEGQEYWKRNNGRDHVFTASDPNALYKIVDKIKNSVLLVSDFGRLRPDQGSLIKDVVIPYSHRISSYTGDIGVANRNTLLFFMGARYRKEGGKIRNLLFQILENEEDVIVKHGTQTHENRRAASHGMHTSKFCLNPAGDTPSACRLFDSIVSLCVPVIISDDIELPFEDVIDYRKIAIFVETDKALEPGFLVSMLRAVTVERILEYQKEIKEVKRYFIYGSGALEIEIWRQVTQKLPLIKLMSNRDKRLIQKNLNKPDCSCLCTNQTGIVTTL